MFLKSCKDVVMHNIFQYELIFWFRHEINPRSLQVLWDSPTLTVNGIDFLMPALYLIAKARTIHDSISSILSLKWNSNAAGLASHLGGIDTKLGQFGSLDFELANGE